MIIIVIVYGEHCVLAERDNRYHKTAAVTMCTMGLTCKLTSSKLFNGPI